jgi:putative transposase
MPYMKPDTGYMKEALASGRRVKYCRIVHRTLKGVRRRFVQLVVESLPPVRKVYAPKCEVVGIAPGPSRIAYFHERHAAIVEVAPHVDLKEPKIRLLQRRIDRSRRANNPDN